MTASPKNKAREVLLWLAFSVVFALGPLFSNYLLVRDNQDFQWLQLLNRGELFLISSALCADAVGRMWGQRGRGRSWFLATICLIACFFVLFMSSVEFGMVAKALDAGGRLKHSQTMDSLKYFGVTVMAGLGAVLVEEQ